MAQVVGGRDLFNGILRRDNISNLQAVYASQLASLASAVTGIACSILGGILISKGLIGALIGIPIVLVGIGSIYLCYNTFRLSQNLERFTNDPISISHDRNILIRDLSKNTFLFRWCVDLIVER